MAKSKELMRIYRARWRAQAAAQSNGKEYTPEQVQALSDYVLDDHGEVGLVRAVQQGKDIGPEQEKYREMGETIERFIEDHKQEYDKIYRGIKAPKSEVDKYVPGYEFDQMGTSSWSGTDGQALRYANRNDIPGIPVMFISWEGKNAANIGEWAKQTLDMNEDEWLVSRNQRFVVEKTQDVYIPQYNANVRIIHVEEKR